MILSIRSWDMSPWQEERVADADPLLSEAGQSPNPAFIPCLPCLSTVLCSSAQTLSSWLLAWNRERGGGPLPSSSWMPSPLAVHVHSPPWDAPICLLLISFRQDMQGRTSGYSNANAAVVELNFLISSMPLCLSREWTAAVSSVSSLYFHLIKFTNTGEAGDYSSVYPATSHVYLPACHLLTANVLPLHRLHYSVLPVLGYSCCVSLFWKWWN